jgi:hypothetical protein
MRYLTWLVLAACSTGSTQVVDGVDARSVEPDPVETPAAPPVETPAARPVETPAAPPVEIPAARPASGGLSDEFDGKSLSSTWTVFKGDENVSFKATVEGGQLHLVPRANCVWYQARNGPALFKRVSGDFKMTSTVRVASVANPSDVPRYEYQFGGLMARHPDSRRENYVFAVVGWRESYLALESKTTVNGESTILAPEWPSGEAELRICRSGATFVLLARKPGASKWIEQGRHQRSDLPAEVQVGPIAYTYTNKYDLRASFDRVEIVPLPTAADCTRD